MASLIDATTGYANDVADWTDTTPQPGSGHSGANVAIITHALEDGVQDFMGSGEGSNESWGVVGD